MAEILLKQRTWNQIWHSLIGHISKLISYFLINKNLKYFNDCHNCSVLWLKWTQKMEMTQNQTFFQGTYSIRSYLLSKNSNVFQWLSKSKFLSVLSKVNSNNENETKADIFSCHIFKPDIIFPMVTKYWNISMSFINGIL